MSWIYLTKNGTAGLVKIGRSRDVASRHGQFATGNPEDMTILAEIETDEASKGESFLHGMFMSRRRRGEFFELTDQEAVEGADLARRFLAQDIPRTGGQGVRRRRMRLGRSRARRRGAGATP